MADTKISALTELTALAVDDELPIVDKSDTTMAASGTDKRLKVQTLQQYIGVGDLPPTGVTFQNYSRYVGGIVGTVGPTTSGTLKLCGIWLPAGFSVATISWVAGTTGLTTAGSGPHFWMSLHDSARNLLRQSNDDTAATWAASTMKTVSLSSAFVTTYAGLHYCGLNVNQGSTGTPPTLSAATDTVTALNNLAPILAGNSTTGLAATAPNPAAAITATTGKPWCGVG